LYSIAMIPVW